MGPAPEREPAPAPRCQAGPSESELPGEDMEEQMSEEERRRRTRNTSQDTGNTTNNPDNNITSRTLEGSLEL